MPDRFYRQPPTAADEERVARAICKAWLKPAADREPAFTDQRWPLFKNEARAAMRACGIAPLEAGDG